MKPTTETVLAPIWITSSLVAGDANDARKQDELLSSLDEILV